MLYNNVGVKQVDVPSFSGSFGILPAHVPTLAVLKPGVVTVYEADGNTKKFFVSSGTVTINEDSTGIMFLSILVTIIAFQLPHYNNNNHSFIMLF